MPIMTSTPSQLPFPLEGVLLHELNHRINNEFCSAISVVSRAAARSSNKEVKAALTDVADILNPTRNVAGVRHAQRCEMFVCQAGQQGRAQSPWTKPQPLAASGQSGRS